MARKVCVKCGKQKGLFSLSYAGLNVREKGRFAFPDRIEPATLPGVPGRDFLCAKCARSVDLRCCFHGRVPRGSFGPVVWAVPTCKRCRQEAPLARKLRSDDLKQVERAIMMLGHGRHTGAVDTLAALLRPDGAVGLLAKVNNATAMPLSQLAYASMPREVAECSAMGALILAADGILATVATALGNIGDTRAVSALLYTAEGMLPTAILSPLAERGLGSAFVVMVPRLALKHRIAAVQALVRLGARTAIPRLAELSQRKEDAEEVCEAAAKAAATLSALPPLTNSPPQPEVRPSVPESSREPTHPDPSVERAGVSQDGKDSIEFPEAANQAAAAINGQLPLLGPPPLPDDHPSVPWPSKDAADPQPLTDSAGIPRGERDSMVVIEDPAYAVPTLRAQSPLSVPPPLSEDRPSVPGPSRDPGHPQPPVEKEGHRDSPEEDEQLARSLVALEQQITQLSRAKQPYDELQRQVRETGERIGANGGSDRMKRIAGRVEALGGSRKTLVFSWLGICGWRSSDSSLTADARAAAPARQVELIADDAQETLQIRKDAPKLAPGRSRCPKCRHEFDRASNTIPQPDTSKMSEGAQVFLPKIMELLGTDSFPHLRCPKCGTTWLENP